MNEGRYTYREYARGIVITKDKPRKFAGLTIMELLQRRAEFWEFKIWRAVLFSSSYPEAPIAGFEFSPTDQEIDEALNRVFPVLKGEKDG